MVGSVGDRVLVGGQLIEPQTREWTRVPRAPWDREHRSSQTVVTGPDGVFVRGGDDGRRNRGDGYLLPA